MNLSLRLNAFALQAAVWSANHPVVTRLFSLAVPMSTFVFAVVVLRRPPCSGSGGAGGGC